MATHRVVVTELVRHVVVVEAADEAAAVADVQAIVGADAAWATRRSTATFGPYPSSVLPATDLVFTRLRQGRIEAAVRGEQQVRGGAR